MEKRSRRSTTASYFATLLFVWKVIAALVLLAPRSPLVKEWAYAGMFIDYSSAVVSWRPPGISALTLAA
jgi:hypothetical protein